MTMYHRAKQTTTFFETNKPGSVHEIPNYAAIDRVRMTHVYDEMVRHLLISIYSGIILFSSSRSVACPSGRSGTTKCTDIS